MYSRACRQYNVHPVAYFYNALRNDKCVLRHRQMTSDSVKARSSGGQFLFRDARPR
ncbi:hypothetical protein DPMN_103534 [Dreissena polymorpha]|uniref:Uncharacterized protein n=1 Tax=Dreissena polymorpha TaxID=45954 RepID=A0A9D4HBB7_DREPO|nr:hypothetical protein DPMN_103534 [Dreissena polymorpha]